MYVQKEAKRVGTWKFRELRLYIKSIRKQISTHSHMYVVAFNEMHAHELHVKTLHRVKNKFASRSRIAGNDGEKWKKQKFLIHAKSESDKKKHTEREREGLEKMA